MKNLVIKTEDQLYNLLKRLHEADDPVAAMIEPAPPPIPSDAPADASPQQAEQLQNPVTLDDIVEKINVIRAGRSTKDPEVKASLEKYIAGFSEEDKVSLLTALDGLGKILAVPVITSTGVPGEIAPVSPSAQQIKPPAPPPSPTPKSPPRQPSSKPAINAGGI